MNCLKCGHPLNTELKCWGCGTQHELTEKYRTGEIYPYEFGYGTITEHGDATTIAYPNVLPACPQKEYI